MFLGMTALVVSVDLDFVPELVFNVNADLNATSL
jgi:hypothetical protein